MEASRVAVRQRMFMFFDFLAYETDLMPIGLFLSHTAGMEASRLQSVTPLPEWGFYFKLISKHSQSNNATFTRIMSGKQGLNTRGMQGDIFHRHVVWRATFTVYACF